MLKQLQNSFIKSIYGDSNEFKAFIPSHFHERINIHQNNTFLGLSENLSNKYAVTKLLLGDEFFEQLAFEYIKTYPKITGDNNIYGANFSQFLSSHSLMNGFDFVAQIAEFEFLRFNSETANIEETIDFAGIIEALNKGENISLSQSGKIFIGNFNCLEIYLAHLQEEQNIELKNQNCQILIFRDKDFNIGFYELSDFQFEFLQNLKNLSFDNALEASILNCETEKAQSDFVKLCNLNIFTKV